MIFIIYRNNIAVISTKTFRDFEKPWIPEKIPAATKSLKLLILLYPTPFNLKIRLKKISIFREK
jgi:hypothetical protein